MKKNTDKQTELLVKKGVVIPDPASVFVAPDVVLDRIAPATIIHPFCRLSGSKTSIGPGCILGAETPATMNDCQLGSQVKLGGGYFSGATFLDGSGMGSGAHVRPGTLLEEEASGAHAVGLKQTVLLPYVVLGSLINFCDCLMAGGTSRKNHSEVGSSYVHFNYSPHQDKATPSLLGDVPGGVLLNKPPIFLGGQGGLVGPARITYGVIAPAGMIIRKDILRPGLAGEVLPPGSPPGAGNAGQSAAGQNQFVTGAYRAVDRIIRNNLVYIGNIYALQAWYHHVRSKFMVRDPFQSACFDGALEQLESMAGERIKRLDELAGKMPLSIELNKQTGTADASCLQPQKHFADSWQRMKEEILRLVQFEGETSKRDVLLSEISAGHGRHQYLKAITLLSPEGKSCASLWLQSIVDRVSGIWKTV